MPRGGQRDGAGRPVGTAVLTAWEQIAVGTECQSRWREDYESRLARAQQEYLARSDYPEATARVRASLREGAIDPDALDDVEFARREMGGVDAEDERDGPRVIHFAVPRPYGLRAAILRGVAAWASEKFEKPVSEGVVRSAWKMVRRVEREPL